MKIEQKQSRVGFFYYSLNNILLFAVTVTVLSVLCLSFLTII